MIDRVEKCFRTLLNKLFEEDFSGYDPYDGLNSKILQFFKIDKFRPLARPIQQVIKRLSFDPRPLLMVPREQNSKGLALCLSAICKLGGKENEETAKHLVHLLNSCKSPGRDFPCWGYNFHWESVLFTLHRYEPNAVCTIFTANALLDAWQTFGWEDCKETAEAASMYFLEELNQVEQPEGRCFSYTKLDRGITHNINLMVCAFLTRCKKTDSVPGGLEDFIGLTLAGQRQDGAWYYGQAGGHSWVDGIHQGFALLSLNRLAREEKKYNEPLSSGFNFYIENLFTEDGYPKYFSHQLYPVDIHNVATSIITLERLKHLDPRAEAIADRVMEIALDDFLMPASGKFLHHLRRMGRKVKTDYIRWGQSWMLRAMAEYLKSRNSQSNS